MTSINQSINIRLLYGMTKCQHCHSIPRSRVPYGVLRPISRPRPTHNCKRNGDTSDFSRHICERGGEVRWDAATAVTAGWQRGPAASRLSAESPDIRAGRYVAVAVWGTIFKARAQCLSDIKQHSSQDFAKMSHSRLWSYDLMAL